MTLLTGHNRSYLLLVGLAVAAILAIGWAALAVAQVGDSGMEEAGTTSMLMEGHSGSSASASASVLYDGPSGIWVTGTGKASDAPDIAIVSVGVESVEDTASAARTRAASAMRGIMSALTNAGVSVDDIQTRHFDISPRYQQVEIERCDSEDDGDGEEAGKQEEIMEKSCYRAWESRLIGYAVSNQAQVKVRSLSRVGTIIDAVTEAAGDLVRISGISFDIEDSQPLEDEARANAVADLKRKAQMLADLSGVKLGRLVHLSEQGVNSPPQPRYSRAEASFSSADSASLTTSISGGELEFTTTVQGVFLIDMDDDAKAEYQDSAMGMEEPEGDTSSQ